MVAIAIQNGLSQFVGLCAKEIPDALGRLETRRQTGSIAANNSSIPTVANVEA